MKRIVSIALLLVLPVSLANAQEMPQQPQPTDAHKVLEQEVGTWECSMKLFLPGMEDLPASSGTEVNELVCDGLWLRTHFTGEFMGMHFEGTGFTGYDTLQKKYVGYWADNMTTSPSKMVGEYDEDTKTLTFMVTGIDPASGEETTQKHTVEYKEDGKKVMTIYMPEETKMLEMTCHRKPKSKTAR